MKLAYKIKERYVNKCILGLVLISLVSCAHQSTQDHLTMATLWAQKAGESHALSYQAFNFAKRELRFKLRRKGKKAISGCCRC
jgi:predicted secreted acid phosphatase